MLCGWKDNRGSSVALAMRQTSVACPPDGLDPTNSTGGRLLTGLHTCSRATSASSALGVLNDYALYKSTHSLTLTLYGLRPKEWI